MKDFFQIFSNRESALIIWIIIIFCFFFSKKEIVKSLGKVIKAFFVKKIIVLVILMIFYFLLLIYLLSRLDLWSNIFIKDLILWFITVAMVLFFKLSKIKNSNFFKNIVFESIKLTILLEFIVNFYNFSLLTEIILTPIVLIIGTMQSFTEVFAYKNPEYISTGKFLKNIIFIISLIFIFYSVYMTFTEYSQLFTLNNLKSLLIPPIFTIWILPLLYLFTLLINYESLFLRIKFISNDINIQKELKRQILLDANFSLDRLMKISDNINREEIDGNLKGFIKGLGK